MAHGAWLCLFPTLWPGLLSTNCTPVTAMQKVPQGAHGPGHPMAFALAPNIYLFSLHFVQLQLILWSLLGEAGWMVLDYVK